MLRYLSHSLGRQNVTARLVILSMCLLALALCLSPATTNAAPIFFENFQGFTSFPDEIPDNDPVNKGLPLESEGAKEKWYGGRFETPDGGTIDSDLAVQQYGGGSNNSKTGRFEDDAGLLFQISTLNTSSATLSFDWKTFSADNGDRFVAGYYVGTIDFAGDRYKDFVAAFGSAAAETWWNTQWTEITRGIGDAWHHVSVALPLNKPNIWVAFWLDNGEGNYAKIDNIKVEVTKQVPEPSTLVLAAMGMVGCIFAQRKVRARRSHN